MDEDTWYLPLRFASFALHNAIPLPSIRSLGNVTVNVVLSTDWFAKRQFTQFTIIRDENELTKDDVYLADLLYMQST